MPKYTQLLIIFFISIFSFVTADAKIIYSLLDLSRIANTQSKTIKIAEQDLEIAKLQKKRAFSTLIPEATLFSSMTEYKNDDIYSPDTITLGFKLARTFTINGKELIAYGIAKKGIEASTYSLESIRSEYLLQVAMAYYDILSSQKYLEIAQSDVKRLTTYRNSVKEKLDVGSLTPTDLYRAEAELSRSITEQLSSSNNILKSKAYMLSMIPIESDFDLQKDKLPYIENFKCDLQNVIRIALKNRPEIKRALKNLEIASKTVEYNKSDYWPTLTLEAGYNERDVKYDSGSGRVEYDSENLYVTGEISIALYDGGFRKATINQSRAEERKARAELTLQEDQVRLECEQAYWNYHTAKRTLINLQDELKSAQENYSGMQMQFKFGMADSIDVMDANTLLVSALRRLSDAHYTFYLSVLNILHTKGELADFLLNQDPVF